ncbi:hypothetical protein EY643_11515 [Halioglobus maricola]|uniref:Peptidase S8/S53 domain-containing protein n=1 Tax=Halioglobus maricola TaxID=2601894 RepID=A0A5P9NKE0_9GAMM|nr:hypothetical protein EY643_11515 [Halioglobus maricola]
MSKILLEQYSVDRSRLPRVYTILSKDISERNELTSDGGLFAQQLLVLPDIPKHANTLPNLDNPYNTFPKISTMATKVSKPIGGSNDRYTVLAQIAGHPGYVITSQEDRVGSDNVVQFREISESAAIDLLSATTANTQIHSAPIEISFTALEKEDRKSASDTRLDEDDVKKLRSWLDKTSPEKISTLVIVDDAWPDSSHFIDSVEFFRQAIPLVREKLNLGPATFSEEFKLLEAKDFEDKKSHADDVHLALDYFRELYPVADQRINIVHVPLFASSTAAKEILINIIEIREAEKILGTELGSNFPSDIQNKARENAEEIIGRMEAFRRKSLRKTDYAVVGGIHDFFRHYAKASKTPFFMNFSWTVPDLQYSPDWRPAYGVVLAAAGNENDSVYKLRREFASRSIDPQDVIAVMDIDSNGRARCCNDTCSSHVEDDSDNYSFAFSGQLPSGKCGTSFSTPRVAYLLAMYESIQVQPDFSGSWERKWMKRFRKSTKTLRKLGKQADYSVYTPSVEKITKQ